MTHQITRYAVICAAIDYLESHFPNDYTATARLEHLLREGQYQANEIYVAKVFITWEGPERE